MSYYQILSRPEGTLPYKQGIGSQLSAFSDTGAKALTDAIFRKAATKAGMKPTYKQTGEGSWLTSYEQPDESPLEQALVKVINEQWGKKESEAESSPFRIKGAKVGGLDVEFPPSEEEQQAELQKKLKEKEEMTKATKTAEANIKRKTFLKDLDSFLAVDDVIKRGKGLGRIPAGIKTKIAGFTQEGPEGFAAATHQAARKRLRVQLVRAAGDVGNINIVEQKAAEMMIPTENDSVETAQLKRAYLKEIGRAINDNDGNAVKDIIGKFINESTEGEMLTSSPKGQIKKGGQVMIDANGNKAMVYPDGSYEEIQ